MERKVTDCFYFRLQKSKDDFKEYYEEIKEIEKDRPAKNPLSSVQKLVQRYQTEVNTLVDVNSPKQPKKWKLKDIVILISKDLRLVRPLII